MEFTFWDEQWRQDTRKRRDKEAGHMAQLIRRKMIQRNHGDSNIYTRKIKHKKGPDED